MLLKLIHRVSRPYVFISLSGVCLLILIGAVGRQPGIAARTERASVSQTEETSLSQGEPWREFVKLLPAGANIVDPHKHVIVADLDADGFAEVTIFYTLGEGAEHRPSIAVLSKTAAGYRVMWEHPYTDGYSSTFAEPTGVYDVNGSGRPQIVAYHTVGASCPGILEIYEYANGSAKAITGDWAGSCQSELEIRDLDGDGIKEIIFRTLKYGTNREIYHWNRNQYVRSNEHFAQHYDDDLNQLVSDVYSDKPYPASARVTWCEQAVQIYTLQKRFSEAIEMCRAVLRMLDQPSLTVPSSVSTVVDSKQQQSRLVASLEADKAKGKGNVYRLLGQLYRATGDLKRSDRCYRAAHQFEAQAQTKAMSLSH